jgi:hypothetical protein
VPSDSFDEVHFEAGGGAPVEEVVAQIGVVVGRPELLQNERLERRTVDFIRRVEGASGSDRPIHPGIEEVELRVHDDSPRGALPEDGEPRGEQEVLEDREVVLDHRPASSLDACVACS